MPCQNCGESIYSRKRLAERGLEKKLLSHLPESANKPVPLSRHVLITWQYQSVIAGSLVTAREIDGIVETNVFPRSF
jgi:hypothetical protein